MRNNIRVGFSLNGKHTYRDYGLYLSEPPDFGSPEPKLRTVDIPGMDGVLDLTESAAGGLKYANRQMRFVFVTEVRREKREALRSALWSDLHGKLVEVIYDLDPEWAFTGRCYVSFSDVLDWKMKIEISVDAQPYKLARDMTSIEIGADSFVQTDIFFGDDANVRNDASVFFDVGNVSGLTNLVLRWDANCPLVGPASVYISDGSAYYSTDSFSYSDYELLIPISALSGLETTAISRVILYGIRYASLYGRTTAGARLTVYNDRMPVCPYWENPNDDSAVVYVNGHMFTLAPGWTQNPDVVFDPGENEIAFTSDDAPDEPLSIRFRKGRL